MKKIISICFVLALFIPLITLNSNNDIYASTTENDNKLINQFTKIDSLVNKNFGFRESMIYINSIIDVMVFNSSPNADVVVGIEGWLFLSDTFKSKELSDSQLVEVSDKFTELENFLSENNVKSVFIPVPDKRSIYPEFVPFLLKNITNKNYENLYSALDNKFVTDLKEYYLQIKQNDILYSKLDSHWNRYGAYLAFRQAMTKLGIDTPEIAQIASYERAGDLSRMVGLNQNETTLTVELEEFEINKNGRVLFYYDSFGEGLVPFMQEYFTTIEQKHILQNSPFEILEGKVNIENYDYVIIEIAERDLEKLSIASLESLR